MKIEIDNVLELLVVRGKTRPQTREETRSEPAAHPLAGGEVLVIGPG